MSFHFKDGYLYCENLKIKAIQDQIPESPFYLYSLTQITENYKAYEAALEASSQSSATQLKQITT